MSVGSVEQFLGFSDADLAANRSGVLSAGQAWRLRWSGVWRLIVGPPLIVVPVVIALTADSGFVTAGALLVAAGGLYLTWHGFAFLADATQGLVAFVTGPLHRRSVSGKGGTSYFADIGPVTKRISRRAYDSLRGGPFHLYYAPGCRSLLSIEGASAGEPKPPHPFGADSVHVWDRVRWSWVLIAIGAAGLLIGANGVATTHAAHPVKVGGTISDYYEHHGKSGTTRYIYMRGDPNTYSPGRESSYDPPVPPFATLIGREVVLYINDGTQDVLAINDGEQLHAGDWYLHPEHETVNLSMNGAAGAGIGVLYIVLGIGLLVLRGRLPWSTQPTSPDPAFERTPLYSMPSVRPARASWLAGVTLAAVALIVVLALELAVHR